MDFAVPADHSFKVKVSETSTNYADLAGELKIFTEHESGSDTNFYWYTHQSHTVT